MMRNSQLILPRETKLTKFRNFSIGIHSYGISLCVVTRHLPIGERSDEVETFSSGMIGIGTDIESRIDFSTEIQMWKATYLLNNPLVRPLVLHGLDSRHRCPRAWPMPELCMKTGQASCGKV